MFTGAGIGGLFPDPTKQFDPRKGGIGDAFALATIAHQGQKYGDGPYVEHPIAVARLIATMYGPYEHLLVPALLHDVVEDTPIQLYEIERVFDAHVAATVDAVTRRDNEVYADFVARAAAHPTGRLVKLADNTHNLSTLPFGDRRERRYLKARAVLVAAMDSQEDPWAALVTDEARS